MDKMQDVITILSNIRDNNGLNKDEMAVLNYAIGLVHEKLRNTNKTIQYQTEDVRFVAENMDISDDVAKALLEYGLIASYENPIGTLSNISKVKQIADTNAKRLTDGGEVERIHRERAVLMMAMMRYMQ